MTQPRRWRAAFALVLALAAADVVALVVVLWPSSGRAAQHPVVPPSTPPPITSLPSNWRPAPDPTTSAPSDTGPQAVVATVAIPVQGVRAPVDICQINDGLLDPPADVHRTCRWAGGAEPLDRSGTTVIVGHINYVGQGTGALGNIGLLHAGDVVQTTTAGGTMTTWKVASVTARPKSTGVESAAFVGHTGPRRLYLITCGGAFDAGEGSYLDNIYVLAVPA